MSNRTNEEKQKTKIERKTNKFHIDCDYAIEVDRQKTSNNDSDEPYEQSSTANDKPKHKYTPKNVKKKNYSKRCDCNRYYIQHQEPQNDPNI